MRSSMVHTDRASYQVRDVIHVRDLLLFTAIMYSTDSIDQDYLWSMDWSRVWSPSDLTVIPAYIHNAYVLYGFSIRLDPMNARNIMRWWNLKRSYVLGHSSTR